MNDQSVAGRPGFDRVASKRWNGPKVVMSSWSQRRTETLMELGRVGVWSSQLVTMPAAQVFRGVVGMSTGPGVRRGCLSVNSAIELAPHDRDVRNRLRRNTRQKESTFAAIIRRGVADGSLRKDLDPDASARLITTVTNGLQVRGKLGLTAKQADETVDMAIEAFV